MKIRINRLLLPIAIFLHFDVLNATEPGEGSSSGERRKPGRPPGSVTTRKPGQVLGQPRMRPADQDQFPVADPNDVLGEGSSSGERRKRGRPRGSVNKRKPGPVLGQQMGSSGYQDQFRDADPNDGPPHRLVYYGRFEIQVWLDGPLVRKAIYVNNYIPEGQYYRFHHFLIRTLQRGDVTLVAYIDQQKELIGVRPSDPTGLRYDLEPTPSEWYINYDSTQLKVNVMNSAPTGISLMSENVHVPGEHQFEEKTVAGITFKLFREKRSLRITGAEFVSYDFRNS